VDPIYLDYNASTPVAPEVAGVMRALLDDAYGNPSSPHWAGAPAREAVERARAQVADLLGCEPNEIVFTSGGSESNNHAIKGTYFASARRNRHIITTRIEHPAVVEPCLFLERLGARVSWLPVDGSGQIDPDDLRRAITPDTILISVMHGIPFHTDAAQSAGKIPTRVDELGVDILTIAGHKLYGPKGTGALYIRNGLQLEPLSHGAGHEAGRRAGTESAVLDAALGQACALAKDLDPVQDIQRLRDRFRAGLEDAFGDGVVRNGHPHDCLPNTLNVSFVERIGADILAAMPQVAASTGSACHAGRVELSPVLEAMGVSPNVGMGAIRFSLGRGTTSEQVDYVVDTLRRVLA